MWNLSFISRDDLKQHVRETIEKYQVRLKSYDMAKFNKNTIDPIKLTFDQSIYQLTWEQTIKNEIARQRDKSSNNDIGYFHQNIFKYMKNCEVPLTGWDVIYQGNEKITIDEDTRVNKIYVELKNKHNTMNAASSSKTYLKMQTQIHKDDESACFLVEVIANKSQNIKWETTVDKHKVSHKLIRRVSIDRFYELVTGEPDAFHDLCCVLPEIIQEVVSEIPELREENDMAFSELQELSHQTGESLSTILYTLGFGDYLGF